MTLTCPLWDTFGVFRPWPKAILPNGGIPKAPVAFLRYSFSYGVSCSLAPSLAMGSLPYLVYGQFWKRFRTRSSYEHFTGFSPCASSDFPLGWVAWAVLAVGSGASLAFASHCVALVLDVLGGGLAAGLRHNYNQKIKLLERCQNFASSGFDMFRLQGSGTYHSELCSLRQTSMLLGLQVAVALFHFQVEFVTI